MRSFALWHNSVPQRRFAKRRSVRIVRTSAAWRAQSVQYCTDGAVRLRYASLFFRVEGNTCRASLSPQELRQGSLWRCGVLLSPRTLSRTASKAKAQPNEDNPFGMAAGWGAGGFGGG